MHPRRSPNNTARARVNAQRLQIAQLRLFIRMTTRHTDGEGEALEGLQRLEGPRDQRASDPHLCMQLNFKQNSLMCASDSNTELILGFSYAKMLQSNTLYMPSLQD